MVEANFWTLAIPAFIAGVLTFLAPCSLPLVPGYLGFISGTSLVDLQPPNKRLLARRKIFINGLLFVLGFSGVFIGLGVLAGLIGRGLAQYQLWLARLGGIFVVIFGLYMLRVIKLPFLNQEKKFRVPAIFQAGRPINSLIFGAAFGFGWTPCVGPILGSILLLASTSATVVSGGLLLAIFSLGLALPFLALALAIGQSAVFLSKISPYLNLVSVVGGLFLVFLGLLMLTNNFGFWISAFYRWFSFINYERLLDYL